MTIGRAQASAVPHGMQVSKEPKVDLDMNPVDSAQIVAIESFLANEEANEEVLEEVEMLGRKWEGIEWAMAAKTTEGMEPHTVEAARK